jgi:hypothetical protein
MTPEDVAAIDLGSNSFHMIVARIANDHVQVLDRLREMVQLAAGLDDKNRLSEESQRRALACLARFGQRLRHIPPAAIADRRHQHLAPSAQQRGVSGPGRGSARPQRRDHRRPGRGAADLPGRGAQRRRRAGPAAGAWISAAAAPS